MPAKLRFSIPFPAPSKGAFLDAALRDIPRDGAALLKDIRVERGLARLRPGSAQLYAPPNSNSVSNLFNLILNDGTVRVLRCTNATGTAGATSAIHYDTGSAWAAVTLDNSFALGQGENFWAVVAPWGASSVGRIIISNYAKIKQWTGNPVDTMTDVAGAFPSRFGFVGPDNRLFLGNVVDGGTQLQEIVWSVPTLPNGNATDWSASGSGAIRLRDNSWPAVIGWVQGGRIIIGKSRSLVALDPTGNPTAAYNAVPISTAGRGVYAAQSHVQWGGLSAWLASDGFVSFDGYMTDFIGGPPPRQLARRLNVNALAQVTSLYLEDDGLIFWGLPMDGSTTANEVWVFDTKTGGWSIDRRAHTALSLYMNVDVTYIAELPGFISGLTGVIASLSSTIAPKAEVIYGTTSGIVAKRDTSLATDLAAVLDGEYVTPAVKPVGEQITVAGKQHIITDDDYLVLTGMNLTLLDLGSTYRLSIEASSDGGVTWALLGYTQVTTAGGTDSVPKVVQKLFTRRYGLGAQGQFRFKCIDGGKKWGWQEIRCNFDILGQTRPAVEDIIIAGEPTP